MAPSTLESSQPQDASGPANLQYSVSELKELYLHAHPYVDWPVEQLIKSIPNLKGLEPAPNQDALPAILEKTGENVDSFFRNFVNTTARERIDESAAVLGDTWTAITGSQDGYYVVLMGSRDGQRRVDEYRMDLKGRPAEGSVGSRGLMLTRGFAGAAIYLHSSRQRESRFRYLGRQTKGERVWDVVAFAQRVDGSTPIGFTARGVSAPLLEQGIVWIDSVRNQITRMRTDLLAPLASIGLERSTTEIEYAPVHFATHDQTFWLPTKVQVTVNFGEAVYCNRHQYSDWKIFTVEAKEVHEVPQANEQEPHDKQ